MGKGDLVQPVEDVHSLGGAKTTHGVLGCMDVGIDKAGNEEVAGVVEYGEGMVDREVEFRKGGCYVDGKDIREQVGYRAVVIDGEESIGKEVEVIGGGCRAGV